MTDVKWEGETLKVSNSEIQAFKDCRRRWWLTHYKQLGLKRSEQSATGPRELGTKVHIALEQMYTMEENPALVIDALYEQDIEALKDHAFGDEMTAELHKEWALARAMVEGFVEWSAEEGLDSGLELVALEEVIEVDSSVPGVKLRGKLDQRWIRKLDGARLFRDWKTVQSVNEPVKTLHMDEQMKFYHLLEYLKLLAEGEGSPEDGTSVAGRTDGALYTMLRKVKRTAAAKPPFYGQAEVHHNLEELRSMWKRTAKVIEEIVTVRQELDAGSDPLYSVPPRPNRDCTWKCDFFTVCPMFDDGSAVDDALEAMYEHRDPHERYDDEELKQKALDWRGRTDNKKELKK